MDTFVVKALYIPPIAINGAKNTILNIITVICCICCISFVLRVINDAVENSVISLLENLITFSKVLLLKVRPNDAATLDAKNPTVMEATILRTVIPNIFSPVVIIYLVCKLFVSIPISLYSPLTKDTAPWLIIASGKSTNLLSISSISLSL